MLIVMKADATERDLAEVERVITEMGYRPHTMPGASRTAIGITGNDKPVDITRFETLHGVAEAIRVTKPYKLVTLDLRPAKPPIIAGPCAVENREQLFAVAEAVKRSGARFFRGGAFKPRTSPYAFQGLGDEGLKLLA